jgi:hypothetical protein
MAVIGFNVCVIVACCINAVAALKIWRLLAIPYIVLDFIRLCILLASHVLVSMIFKKQLNLGVLIAVSSAGGFFILFLGYMWCCSIAFFQMVGVVRSRSYQKMISVRSPAPVMTISSITPKFRSPVIDTKYEKSPTPVIFASDFSEYYKKSNFRMPSERI